MTPSSDWLGHSPSSEAGAHTDPAEHLPDYCGLGRLVFGQLRRVVVDMLAASDGDLARLERFRDDPLERDRQHAVFIAGLAHLDIIG